MKFCVNFPLVCILGIQPLVSERIIYSSYVGPENVSEEIYYINTLILCVCLCVFVSSEMYGTGGRSTTLIAPTWRALRNLAVFM